MAGLYSPIQLHTAMNNDINGRVNQLQAAYYIAVELLYKLKCLKCCSQFLLHTCVQLLCVGKHESH